MTTSKTVKELLVEMKDVSELMIDLAYSALLLNNKEIASEVERLEKKMDSLKYEIRIMAMLAARTPEEAEQLSGILHVAASAEAISNAAKDIADVVLRGLASHPLIEEALSETEEIIKIFEVKENSILVGKSLGELRLATETGMYVIAIRRGNEWIYGPDKDVVIQAGDSLIARGTETGSELLSEISSGERRWF
ncbi:MAG: potassium channel family protein [Candidatus Hydrothermarchaeota archaeon]